MSDSERAKQVKDLIRRHLAEVGAARWKVVRRQCQDISDATFWRHVKTVREEGNEEEDEIGAAAAPAVATDDDVPPVGALPAFYNPLQKARQYESLLADAEALRAHALDRRGKITDARQFEKSIVLRERLLAQQAEILNFFQNQEANKVFYEQLTEMVMELPKEVARKFIERLGELQQRQLAASQV